MDNLTTAIIAAVAGSGATFLLTKASVIARFPARSWLVRRTTRKFQTLRDRYGVKRTRKIVRNWFSTHQGISHLNINDFERAKRTRAQQKPQLRTFSFMNLRQPRFAPRLDDHYIAASIDELCNRGTLVRLPEAQIGGGYSHARCQPAEAMSQSIRYFGGSPSEAREREAEAEIARCCIECHFWKIVDGCPGTRYSFQSTKEEREDRTIYGTKIVENDEPGKCHRCWKEQ